MIVAKLKFILLLLLGAIAVEASARDARLFARDGKAQGGFPIK